MNCTQCGARLGRDSKFCDECGRAVGAASSVATATPAPAAAPPRPQDAARPPAGRSASSASDPFAGDDLDGLRTVATPGHSAQPGGKALEPGTVFDRRYEIQSVLGRGGMGIVYKAKDTVTGDAVCLKLVHPELVASEQLAQRFLREGKLTRSLRHPNIVSVFDVNNADGTLYLSMECIEGQSLRTWITQNLRERRTVPLGVALHIAGEIAAGLSGAHHEGVVHRDLKPENVMLVGDPFNLQSPCRVKVLDFGIARAFASTEHLTVAGAALGTPAYMAPEQETNADAVGPEADVYSLGAVLYEVLLNVAPRGRFELPSVVRQDLPRALDSLIERSLSPHPTRRPPTAVAFVDELTKVPTGGGSGIGGLGNGGQWAQRLGDQVRQSWDVASGRRWPRTVSQWMVVAWIPGFAWAGWLTLWLRTKKGEHIGFAVLHSLTMFCGLIMAAATEAGSGSSGYMSLTGTDYYGNPIPTWIETGGSDEATAVAGFFFLLGVVGWVLGVVHARRAKPMIEALIADAPR
jgi:hypothetical protein